MTACSRSVRALSPLREGPDKSSRSRSSSFGAQPFAGRDVSIRHSRREASLTCLSRTDIVGAKRPGQGIESIERSIEALGRGQRFVCGGAAKSNVLAPFLSPSSSLVSLTHRHSPSILSNYPVSLGHVGEVACIRKSPLLWLLISHRARSPHSLPSNSLNRCNGLAFSST